MVLVQAAERGNAAGAEPPARSNFWHGTNLSAVSTSGHVSVAPYSGVEVDDHTYWVPFGLLRKSRVLVHDARESDVPRNPLSLVEGLDGAIREARFHGLSNAWSPSRLMPPVSSSARAGSRGVTT